jgi:hypothetical protein
MSAQYYGSYPVKRITAANIVGQGILIKTQKIVCKSSEVDSYLPTINSTFTEDSTLWVTDVKIDDQQNGLAEITVVAQGTNENSSTIVEIQPGGVFIFGLKESQSTDFIPNANPSSGATVKVSFVDQANNESRIISTYSLASMPSELNGMTLPSYTAPGVYGNPVLTPQPNQADPNPPWRHTYKGYICKDIQAQRQGSALAVSLFYKESGYLETFQRISQTQATISRTWDY